MPYVTSIERVVMRETYRKGIKSMLKVRFGDEGLKLMPELEEVYDTDKLEAILNALETAKTLDEIRSETEANYKIANTLN